MNINDIKAAVDAARERREEDIQDCPFCDSPIVQTSPTETGYTVYCLECNSDSGSFADVDDALILWNTRPAQQQADAALIALWEMTQIDESVFETAKTILSEPAYHSADAALLAHAIMRIKESTDE